jgi:hypothetical protein
VADERIRRAGERGEGRARRAAGVLEREESPEVLAGHEVEVAVAVEIAQRGNPTGDVANDGKRIGGARARYEGRARRAAGVLEIIEATASTGDEIEVAVAVDVA